MDAHFPRWILAAAAVAAQLLGAAYVRAQTTEGSSLTSPAAIAGGAAPHPAAKSGASANADDLDSLLDAAEKDVSQLGRVSVTAAPALAEEVTTVSRQVSTVGKSPAAVFVITQDMILHSGCNNIPDLLRLVPGLEVARIDANKWAISSRGFNNLYAKDLLVLIDGRAVYTQLFSGVFWDLQDVVLPDIERIEVVRGPGATVWGANAVNGVINIITKKAADTQGALVIGGTGTEERGFSSLRYGGQVGDDLHWRIYGKQFVRDGGYYYGDDFDDWSQGRGGFRADWTPTPDDTITAEGDLFDGESGERGIVDFDVPPFQSTQSFDTHVSGQDAIVRWSHVIDDDSDWSLQTYYDRLSRVSPFVNIEQEIADVDAQYRFPVNDRHNVICGAGYRRVSDHFYGNFGSSLIPPKRNTDLLSCFIQDEIMLSPDFWYLIAGSKFEHNDFSGFEYQPSVRLLCTPSEAETIWAAVSRAVRTPSRVEDDLVVNTLVAPGPTFARILGNTGLEAEDLLAFELGYRAQPTESFSWDLATFYNDYSGIIDVRSGGAPFVDPTIPALIVPLVLDNVLSADTYGAELASTLQVRDDWQLSGAYTLLYMDMHAAAGDVRQGSSPNNQAKLRSSWHLNPEWDLDLIGRYVDNLPALGISSYLTMDARLAWHPYDNFEWALVGRNLFDDRHAEFRDVLAGLVGTEVQAEVYTTLTWTR